MDQDCGRWVASYPAVSHPTFAQAESWDCPDADGLVCMWQFASDGMLQGYNGNLDADIFYGDAAAWNAYAGVKQSQPAQSTPEQNTNQNSSDDEIIISKGDGSNPTKYKKIS